MMNFRTNTKSNVNEYSSFQHYERVFDYNKLKDQWLDNGLYVINEIMYTLLPISETGYNRQLI